MLTLLSLDIPKLICPTANGNKNIKTWSLLQPKENTTLQAENPQKKSDDMRCTSFFSMQSMHDHMSKSGHQNSYNYLSCIRQ